MFSCIGHRVLPLTSCTRRQITQKRKFYQIANWIRIRWNEWNVPPLHKMYQTDKVSRARNIVIYRCDNPRKWLFFAGFITVPCMVAVVGRPVYNWAVGRDPFLFSDDPYSIDNSKWMNIVAISVACALCCSLIVVRKRIIHRIYYDESRKEFTAAVYRTFFPVGTRTFKFKPGQAVVREVDSNPTRFSWNCKINGSKYYLEAMCFKLPVYYNVLFGFDDPDEIGKLHDTDATWQEIYRDRAYIPDDGYKPRGPYVDKNTKKESEGRVPWQ